MSERVNSSSADPGGGVGGGGGTRGPTPPHPGKSQAIWVSIGNKQLDPPPWKMLDPLQNL